MTQKTLLDRLESEVRDQLEEARTRLVALPPETLRFRPAPDAWNVLECVAHLNAFCDAYFARIELSMHKAKARRWLSGPGSGQPGVDDELHYTGRGQRAIRRADPGNGKRYKSPKRYNFVHLPLGPDVVKAFIIHAEKMLRLLQAAREVDLNRATVLKAHAWTARYTLGNLLEMLVTHQRRHLIQAREVLSKIN